jgi:hypothetical protein
MEQQQIVSAEDFISNKGYSGWAKNTIMPALMEEYASLKLQSLTTERDEALKANDLLCEKIDKKDEEIARLEDQLKNQDNVLIARLNEVQGCRDQVDRFRKALANRDELNKEYLEALKSVMGMWQIANKAHYDRNSDAVSKFTSLIQKSKEQ